MTNQFVDQFNTRFRHLVATQPLNQGQFAAQLGIDRSTLSQLLSPHSNRLPRAETLAAIAQTLGVSLDWLLGLSDDGQARTEMMVEQMSIERDALSPNDERLMGWLTEAIGSKVRYVPMTIPDLLKQDAVIRHELNKFATVRPEQQMETAAARLDLARRPGTDVEACSSVQSVEGFVRGEGIWATFDRRKRLAAVDHMIELLDEIYPNFRWFLFDGRQRYSTPITIFGVRRAALYLGQMFLVVNSEDHVRTMIEHFDDLIRAAIVQPVDVPRLLRKLRLENS